MMQSFEGYAQSLETLALAAAQCQISIPTSAEVKAALDGGPGRALRSAVSLQERRDAGAFFTGSELAGEAVRLFGASVASDSVFLDPACGAGDLLIAASRLLAVSEDLEETIESWGSQLAGCDLQEEFIRATKARLLLAAICRGAVPKPGFKPDLKSIFPLIRKEDGLQSKELFQKASHIIVNPSFSRVLAAKECEWGSGKVSLAAIFIDACVSNARPKTQIAAILPDVLRTGTFYTPWREYITERAILRKAEAFGQFDKHTDIDVFILLLKLRCEQTAKVRSVWWREHNVEIQTGDLFEINVGRVVPHRDMELGPEYPFIHSKTLPRWKRISFIAERRQTKKKAYKPPFVAIRRTSRPDDRYRAVGTIITCDEMVAVENHLIIATPKDGTIRSCKKLLEVLRSEETNAWLNERIRCRHLTASSIKELPWGI